MISSSWEAHMSELRGGQQNSFPESYCKNKQMFSFLSYALFHFSSAV